jgi:hypothetical protein
VSAGESASHPMVHAVKKPHKGPIFLCETQEGEGTMGRGQRTCIGDSITVRGEMGEGGPT